MLDVAQLKSIPEETVFARGEGLFPRAYHQPIRWVAKRGIIHDWCIYYGLADWDWERVEKEGDKAFTPELIKDLVPCDKDAFEMYRY